MAGWTTRRGALALALTAALGCTPGGGGGGGGDCREADDACSAGFVCVAVGGGSSYACRASCEDDGDCLRDEQCIEGLCGDREGPIEVDADNFDPVLDAEVDEGVDDDAGPIRLVDAEPPPDAAPPEPDRGVVVLPGACEGRFDLEGTWLLEVALGFAPESPIYFRVEVAVTAGGDGVEMVFDPLRVRDRTVIEGHQTVYQGPLGEAGELIGEWALESPAQANRFGGGDIAMMLAVEGTLRPPVALCGHGDGETTMPRGLPLRGTEVAMVRWREPIAAVDPLPACADCLR